mgnify:CR=1 FL=1
MKITSWDANMFLCLIEWGLPEDVVKRMWKVAKKIHEEFSLREAMTYWVSNSPQLESRTVNHGPKTRECIFTITCRDEHERNFRIDTWQNRRKNIIEFKREWRLRSIEERQKKVIDWCKFGTDFEQDRHHKRLSIKREQIIGDGWIKESFKICNWKEAYTKNLWKSWEAWSHCNNASQLTPLNWDAEEYDQQYHRAEWDRRDYVSHWYEGIHPGRFFLFYKENQIIKERNRGVPRGPCEDGYEYPKTPIFDWGPYEQLIEDLKCLDGGGLGESVGKTVEHIDDLFI